MCKASEYTKILLENVNSVYDETHRLYDIVHECDLKICDIMHDIELNSSKDMYSAWLLINEIKQARLIRRQAKDEIETLRIINNCLNQAKMTNRLKNVSKAIDDKKDKLQHRTYNIRTGVKIADLVV